MDLFWSCLAECGTLDPERRRALSEDGIVLIAEIVEVERFEQEGSEHVLRLADDLEHLVSTRGMLVVRPVL